MIEDMRIELQDTNEILYTNDDLIRGIHKSVSLMSRLLPKRVITTQTLTNDMIYTPYMLDISSFLTDFIRIERVVYPVGSSEEAPENPTFDPIYPYLILRKDLSLIADKSIQIVYLSKWTPPKPEAIGDYPEHLDDSIIIGASGQALIYKAEKYVQLAAASIDKDIDTLDAIEAVVLATPPTLTTYLEAVTTYLGKADTKFLTQLAAQIAAGALMESGGITVMSNVTGLISSGSGFLSTGAPFINDATRGAKVGETYGQYSQACAALAAIAERLSGSYASYDNSRANFASAEVNAGIGHVNQAVQVVATMSRLIELYNSNLRANEITLQQQLRNIEASRGYETATKQYLEVAGRYLASGQAKINEFLAGLGIKPEFYAQKFSAEQRD